MKGRAARAMMGRLVSLAGALALTALALSDGARAQWVPGQTFFHCDDARTLGIATPRGCPGSGGGGARAPSGGGGYVSGGGGGGGGGINKIQAARIAMQFGGAFLNMAAAAEAAAQREAAIAEQARLEAIRRERQRNHGAADAANQRGNALFNGWNTAAAITAYKEALQHVSRNGDERNAAVIRRNLAAAQLLHAALDDTGRVAHAQKAYGGNNPYAKTASNPFAGPSQERRDPDVIVDDFYHPRLSEEEVLRRAREACASHAGTPDEARCLKSAKALVINAEESFIRSTCAWYRSAAEQETCSVDTHASLSEKARACAAGRCVAAARKDEEYVYGCYTRALKQDAQGWTYVSPKETCADGKPPVRRASTSLRDSLRKRLQEQWEEDRAQRDVPPDEPLTPEQVDIVKVTVDSVVPEDMQKEILRGLTEYTPKGKLPAKVSPPFEPWRPAHTR